MMIDELHNNMSPCDKTITVKYVLSQEVLFEDGFLLSHKQPLSKNFNYIYNKNIIIVKTILIWSFSRDKKPYKCWEQTCYH